MLQGQITQLFTYPVKSCAPVSLEESECNELGLRYDREWAIVDSDNKVLTQRDYPGLTKIFPEVDLSGHLTLRARNQPALVIESHLHQKEPIGLKLWDDHCKAFDQGREASEWLTKIMNVRCKLLRVDKSNPRQSRYGTGTGGATAVAFADCCPLLIMAEESLEDLNARLVEPIPMNRFRPSIVVRGLGKYAEDTIVDMTAGTTALSSVKPCTRCVIVTIDQSDGSNRGPEPMTTLATYRKFDGHVCFGQYFRTQKPGRLQVGDLVSATSSN